MEEGGAAVIPQDSTVGNEMDEATLELKTRLWELCAEPKTEDELIAQLQCSRLDVAQLVNVLSKENKLDILQLRDQLLFKQKSSDMEKILNEMPTEPERLVYQQVENAGNEGIWTKHLRIQTGLDTEQFKKILKKLEQKKLIKCVQSVAQTKRRMYMLYHIEPATSLTGGAWWSDQVFDSDFLKVLQIMAVTWAKRRAQDSWQDATGRSVFDREKGKAFTAMELREYLLGSGALNADTSLTLSDVNQLITALICDGKLFEVEQAIKRSEPNPPKRYSYNCASDIDDQKNRAAIITSKGMTTLFDVLHDLKTRGEQERSEVTPVARKRIRHGGALR